MDAHKISIFKADFRYDQTKLTGSSDMRLDILRYTAASGGWWRVGSPGWGEHPTDGIVSICGYQDCSDTSAETYNLGTFAVAERENQGQTVIVR